VAGRIGCVRLVIKQGMEGRRRRVIMLWSEFKKAVDEALAKEGKEDIEIRYIDYNGMDLDIVIDPDETLVVY
jgi:hypothetical protein